MENRIKTLEEFQKKWKFYFWAVVVIGGLAAGLLGWNITIINEKISTLNENISKAEEHLQDLNIKSKVAEKASDNALKQAGDLETALKEARAAYDNAAKAAEQSIDSSKKAIEASNNALNASKESHAISVTVDEKIRRLEKIIADLKIIKSDSNPSAQSAKTKLFKIKLSGIELKIRFVEGTSPYDEVNLNQSYYQGVVYIPKNMVAKITGDVRYSVFTISKELKGRVIDNTSGIENVWTQE